MRKNIALLCGLFCVMSGAVWAATSCSRANLTRCLDSVCAINISSNAAARCQYCGVAGAGTPPTGGMRSVSVGTSTKYNIPEKELKKAPKDQGARYAWAAEQCLKKVTACTIDDVYEVYNPLIEQSCRAAGVVAEMQSLLSDAAQTRSLESCVAEISACVVADDGCAADFSKCKSDSDFDRVFSNCNVKATGCAGYTADVRAGLASSRDSAIKNAAAVIDTVVASYQNARKDLLANVTSQCASNVQRDDCIARVCATNMPNRCGDGFQNERALATKLCKFYDIACDTLE